MKLKDILAKGSEAIAAASFILSQKLDTLDCREIETIAAEELTLLLSKIPPEWDLVELAEIFQQDTLTETFSNQLVVSQP